MNFHQKTDLTLDNDNDWLKIFLFLRVQNFIEILRLLK